MKITCAINERQAGKLYKTVYKSLSAALEAGETFDANQYMADLFDSIADKKDEDTAIKFLQQVPSLIRTIAAKPAFDNLDLKLDPIKELSINFKDLDKGFDNVLQHFKPQMTQRSKMALLRANEIEASKGKEVEPSSEIKDPVRLRPSDAMTATMQQLIPINPTQKQTLVEERIDSGKQRIYSTLEKVREAIDKAETVEITDTIQYQGRKLKLKPILLSKLAETHSNQLDIETRKNLVERSAAIKNKGLTPANVETANTIALVLADENGNYHYFDAEGNITSEEKGGGIVYQFLRNVKKTGGKYEMTNAYGYASTIQTPAEIAAKYGITEQEAEKIQQQELEELYNLRQQALKGEAPELDLVGLSPGVKESIAQKKITLQNLREFPFVNNATFRSIKPVMTPGGDTSAVIVLNGKEYGIDRPNITDDLINKIALVLSDPKFSNQKKYEFVQQFLSDNASMSTRRHKINYNPGTDTLLFSYTEKTKEEGTGKTFALTNEELNGKKDLFVDVLKNASKDKYGNMYSAKMSYNADVLGRNGYLDYNLETNEINDEYSLYLPLLETLPNTKIMMSQQTDPGFFNSYMRFALPTEFNKEFNESVNSPEVSIAEEPISDIAFNSFVNFNIVSDKILNDIADAYIKGQPLSPRQQQIFTEATAEMERVLSERVKQEQAQKAKIAEPEFNLDDVEIGGIINGFENIYGAKNLGDIRNDIPFQTERTGTTVIEKNGNTYAVAWSGRDANGGAIREYGGSSSRPGYISVAVKIDNNYESAQSKAVSILQSILPTIKDGKINKSNINNSLNTSAQKKSIDNIIDPKNTNNPSTGGISSLFDLNRKGVDLGSVTEEDIKNAQEWWNNSPLSKFIDFKTMVNIVNSDVYAKFIAYGSKLNEKFGKIEIGTRGTIVDVYHEAWHAFSQIFLTPEQRTKLYDEVAKQKGSFTLLDGTTVKFSEATYLQLEEYLAEDFRSFGIDQSSRKGAPVRNSIFRKIADFLKALFGLKSTKENLFNALYFADKNKNFLNQYSPVVDTYSFNVLNRGIESLENTTIDALSRQDSNLVSASIDSYMSDIVDQVVREKNNKGAALRLFIGEKNKNVLYDLVRKDFEKKLSSTRADYELLKNDPAKVMEAEKLLNNIRILETAIENFGDSKKGVIKYHLENSTFNVLRQKFVEVEEQLEEEGKSKEPQQEEANQTDFEKSLGKKSLLDLASKETLYLLKSLHKIEKGKPVVNELGYKVLADFATTWNNVMRAVNGEKNPEQIYQKIKQAGEEVYPEFKQLIATKLPDPNSMSDIYQAKTLTSFWQDVQRTRATYLQTTIFDNNIAEVTKASIETLSLIRKFEAKFKSDLNNKYIERSPDNNIALLNLKKVVDDFGNAGVLNADKSYEFARAIGLYLDDLRAIKNELNKNQSAKERYGLPYIYKLLSDLNKLNEAPNTQAKVRDEITKLRMNPINTLINGIPAGVVSNKEENQKNKIEKIVSLQAKYGADSANFAVLNAERNLVFEHIDDHTVSMITYALNQAKNMKDFWTKGSELEFMSYLDPSINSFTKRLNIINTLFNIADDYVKRDDKSLQMFINSGTQVESEDSGTNTTSLDVYGKFLQEMHSMLKGGVMEFMRHASKKASFGARIEGGVEGGVGRGKKDNRLWVDLDKFAVGTANEYATRVHMIPYLAGELERINKFRSNPKLYDKFTGYNRPMPDGTVAGANFTAFDNVLTKDTKEKILAAVTDPNVRLEDYLKTDADLKRDIEKDIDAYFKSQTEDVLDFYEEAKYMSPDLIDRLKVFNMSQEDAVKTLVNAYVMNSWIQNFETATLFYGDIAQYNHEKEELHKRNTGSTSGGLKFRTDNSIKDFLTELNGKVSYAATLPGMETLTYTGKYNTAIVKDIKRTSEYIKPITEALTKDYTEKLSKVLLANEVAAEVKKRVDIEVGKYKGMEEGDGQGWITFDAYRSLKIASGQWSDLQEELFKKVINNVPISAADVVEMFPVYKLQNYGHLADTDIPVMAMHKFALAPLIPSMIKGSDLQSLHEQMMKSNIQYVTFQTGSKVGSVTSDGSADVIYDNDDQKVLKSNIKFTPNTIYLEYLKDVTKVPVEYKGKTVFATQLRKLILSNMYNEGKIVNKQSEAAVKAYEQAVDDYGNLLKTELLNEIGYEYDEKTGKYTGNFENFLNLIQKELGRRNIPEHHIEFVNMNPDKTLKTDLSLHLKSDDIEKILVSLIEKRLIRQKVRGEALVQVSSAMTNGMWGTSTKFDAADEESVRKYLGTNNLPFYNPGKDGTSAMKVAIALQGDFTNLLNLNYKGEKIGNRARLNEAIKDEEWLNTDNNRKAVTLTAVRIPVQGLNSMEYMEVHEFLDDSAGNIIIPPTEIVAKSGADFDVDKLTTFMPAIDKSGRFIESQLSNDALKRLLNQNKSTAEGQAINQRIIATQKAALENRLITTINDILKLPENYAALVRPNDTYLLKDELADKLEDKVSEYNRFQNYHGEEQRPGKKAKRSISPTRVLEPLYNLHKHEANMIGKAVLGLAAIYNALHPVFNSIGAAMPASYKNTVYDPTTSTFVEGTKDLKTRLLLPHNKTTDGRISLSGIQTQDGDIISDLYSQLINGAVDVEKDAWIFFIQGNMELVPTLAILLKAGVPKDYAVKFLSQPMIREYAKQQRRLGSSYANLVEDADKSKDSIKTKAAKNVLARFGVTNPNAFLKNSNYHAAVTKLTEKSGILNKDGNFDIKLLDRILENPGNPAYDNHQLAIFMHFIEMEKQFSGMQDLIRLANPDTTTSKTIQEVIRRNMAMDEMLTNSKVDPALVEGLRKQSILGTFYDNQIISDLIEPLFKLKDNKFVTDSIVGLVKNKRSAIKKAFGTGPNSAAQFISTFKNGIVNSIYQNYMRNYVQSDNDVLNIPTEMLSKYFTDNIFFENSDVSFAEDLMDLINKHPQLKEKFSVLQQLSVPILPGDQKILTLNDQKLLSKGEIAEQYYENLQALSDPNVEKVKDPEENRYISNMFKVLPLVALYQNGVGYSKYAFNEILPFGDFVTLMDKATNEFMETQMTDEKMLEIFDITVNSKDRNFKNYLSNAVSTSQPGVSINNISTDTVKEDQLESFTPMNLTFGGKSIAEQLQILNSPEFKNWFAEETIKNPNLDASEALDYYIKCKGL